MNHDGIKPGQPPYDPTGFDDVETVPPPPDISRRKWIVILRDLAELSFPIAHGLAFMVMLMLIMAMICSGQFGSAIVLTVLVSAVYLTATTVFNR